MTCKSLLSVSTMTCFTLTSAFTSVTTRTTTSGRWGIAAQRQDLKRARQVAPLSALIYGWDGGDDDDETYKEDYSFGGEADIKQCSPAGVAVAESLSYDPDRVGSLARLAVAFSPPERALSLDIIENVEVICVREDSIDIQAILCEEGGCVSVAVPIKFPYECDSNTEWLEGCVRRNLEELDETASLTLRSVGTNGDNDDLCVLESDIDYPSWWIPPGCSEAMSAECTIMRNILNEDEFQKDIIALAQDSLNHASTDGEGYTVKEAKVAAIGPAGLCFKVRAEYRLDAGNPTHVLDVMYPFGGEPRNDPGELRATVLGVVATAEG